MIAYIQGEITFRSPTYIYIETHGMGYQVHISLQTFERLEGLNQAKIYTYFHVKEDSQSLYGFYEESEKQIFTHLISVSGIGPNTARVILSYMSTEEVKSAIVNENVVALSSVKGIGPKTAKRVILDLKDKIFKESGDIPQLIPDTNNTLREEAVSALMALGFPKASVSKNIATALKNDPSISSVENLIKKVLKQMS